MKIEDFKKVTSDIIANLSDQTKVTDYLTQLSDSYESTYTNNSVLQEEKTNYENEIKALKDTNMKLFLKVQNPETSSAADSQNEETEPELSFDNVVETLGGSKQ